MTKKEETTTKNQVEDDTTQNTLDDVNNQNIKAVVPTKRTIPKSIRIIVIWLERLSLTLSRQIN